MAHPHLAARTCLDCRTWQYADQPGRFADEPAKRGGLPVRRSGGRPPCSYCPKQPADVPDAERTPHTAADLSPKNWLAYHHYCECAAVGEFPDDVIVRRNAGLIGRITRDVEQMQVQQLTLLSLGRR